MWLPYSHGRTDWTGTGLSAAAPAVNSQSLLDMGDLPLLGLVSPTSSDRPHAEPSRSAVSLWKARWRHRNCGFCRETPCPQTPAPLSDGITLFLQGQAVINVASRSFPTSKDNAHRWSGPSVPGFPERAYRAGVPTRADLLCGRCPPVSPRAGPAGESPGQRAHRGSKRLGALSPVCPQLQALGTPDLGRFAMTDLDE